MAGIIGLSSWLLTWGSEVSLSVGEELLVDGLDLSFSVNMSDSLSTDETLTEGELDFSWLVNVPLLWLMEVALSTAAALIALATGPNVSPDTKW